MRKLIVRASRQGQDLGIAKSDERGFYRFVDLPAGALRLEIESPRGYLPSARNIVLVEGGNPPTVDFKVRRSSVIAGRVLDSSREPVAGASVRVRYEGYRMGRAGMLSEKIRYTNDLGEFRMADLDPGDYIVHVTPPPIEFHTRTDNGPEEGVQQQAEVRNAPASTYYGGSRARAGASLVTVRDGAVREGLEIVMSDAPSACVSATIRPPGAASISGWIGVMLSEPYQMSQSRVAMGRTREPGTVEACGIAPGNYRMSAATQDAAGHMLYAEELVSVSGDQPFVRLPDLNLDAPFALDGKLTVVNQRPSQNGDAAATLPKVSISLEPADRLRYMPELSPAKIESNGDFVIPLAFRSNYWIHVDGIPAGYYVKNITAGGTDVYAGTFRPEMGTLRVELGADGPSLTAVAVDSDGRPVEGATVILARPSADAGSAPNEILAGLTDAKGQFSFAGFAPGVYTLVALEGLPRWQERSAPALRAISQSNEKIEAPPFGSMVRTVKVVRVH